MRKTVREYSLILIGSVLYAISTLIFIFPCGLLLGGTSGISVILATFLTRSSGTLLGIINFGLIVLAFFVLGKEMAVKTLVGSVLTTLSVTCRIISEDNTECTYTVSDGENIIREGKGRGEITFSTDGMEYWSPESPKRYLFTLKCGESGGELSSLCDVTVRVPASETYLVKEYHLPVYHAICAEVEQRLFGN